MVECARDQTTKGLLPAKMTARVPFTHSPFACCCYWVGVGATLSPSSLLPLQPSDHCMLILLRPSWQGAECSCHDLRWVTIQQCCDKELAAMIILHPSVPMPVKSHWDTEKNKKGPYNPNKVPKGDKRSGWHNLIIGAFWRTCFSHGIDSPSDEPIGAATTRGSRIRK